MNKKVLVVDDDPGIVDVLRLMLEDEGYEVYTSLNGETFKHVKQYKPDLILLDIWMSGRNGKDICSMIKKDAATKHIPVIMVSANKDGKQIAVESFADDFIAKPFEMDDLLAKVAEYTLLKR